MNNREAMQEAFKAWWDGRQLPENMKAAFFMVWQAALASQQPDHSEDDLNMVQSQAQQPTAYRVIASANGEVVRDSLEFTRMSEIDEKVVRKSYDLEIFPLYAAMQSQAQKPAFPPRDLTKPAEQQGMFSKFHVERVDGSSAKGGKHHGCRYWVLDLDHDKHAPAAMRGYAEDCKETHPVLSAEIFAEFGMQSQVQQTERQWLPMETAPKDKTKILIKFIKHEAASSEVVDAWFEDGWRRIDYGRNTYVYLVGCELLGWMPLPPAPEGDKP